MVVNVSDVLSAYKKNGGIIDDAGSAATSTVGSGNFADTLKTFTGNAIGALHDGEKAATASVSGKADLASVVTAMDNAELVLTEITAVRDKVISAYQTITSSAI